MYKAIMDIPSSFARESRFTGPLSEVRSRLWQIDSEGYTCTMRQAAKLLDVEKDATSHKILKLLQQEIPYAEWLVDDRGGIQGALNSQRIGRPTEFITGIQDYAAFSGDDEVWLRMLKKAGDWAALYKAVPHVLSREARSPAPYPLEVRQAKRVVGLTGEFMLKWLVEKFLARMNAPSNVMRVLALSPGEEFSLPTGYSLRPTGVTPYAVFADPSAHSSVQSREYDVVIVGNHGAQRIYFLDSTTSAMSMEEKRLDADLDFVAMRKDMESRSIGSLTKTTLYKIHVVFHQKEGWERLPASNGNSEGCYSLALPLHRNVRNFAKSILQKNSLWKAASWLEENASGVTG